jgi:hypothetical protein
VGVSRKLEPTNVFRARIECQAEGAGIKPADSMNTSATLIFLCGKMAAGKSTLARELAEHRNAILLVQDELLDQLFPVEITDMPGFVDRSSRLRDALTPHILAILSKGLPVVLDFPATQRRSARGSGSSSSARTSSTSCTSSTRRMPRASASSEREVGTCLPERHGRQMRSSRP